MAGATVVDIGANVGSVCGSFLERMGSGQLWAIEPHAELCRHLRRKFPSVTVIHAAVSDQEGTATLYHSLQTPHASLYPANVLASANSSEVVPLVTIDGLIARGELPTRIDFIKVDAQGAETAILRGAADLLAQHQTAWYVELWPFGLTQAGSSLEELCDALHGAGLVPLGDSWDAVYAQAVGQRGHASHDVLAIPGMRTNLTTMAMHATKD